MCMKSQHTFAKLKIESDLLNDKEGKYLCFKYKIQRIQTHMENNNKIELKKI